MTSVLEAAAGNRREGERLKSNLLQSIRKLDEFPKVDMFVGSSGKVEQRWGIKLRNKFDENFFVRAFLVTWHGIQVADMVDAFKSPSQIQPEKYPDYESMREATAEEYIEYYGKAYDEVQKALKEQDNRISKG